MAIFATNLYINKITTPVLSLNKNLLINGSSTDDVDTNGVFLNGILYVGQFNASVGAYAVDPSTLTIIKQLSVSFMPVATDGTYIYGYGPAPSDIIAYDPSSDTQIASVGIPAGYAAVTSDTGLVYYSSGTLFAGYFYTGNSTTAAIYAYKTPDLTEYASTTITMDQNESFGMAIRKNYLYVTYLGTIPPNPTTQNVVVQYSFDLKLIASGLLGVNDSTISASL